MTTDTTNENRSEDGARMAGTLANCGPSPVAAQLVDVMIDIETLGTSPGAAVLSIGAVMFGQAGLGETFYAPILLSSCTAAGLTIDPGTVTWWMKQSDAARAAAFREDAEALPVVLYRFTAWFTESGAERTWCHGATFDAPLLEAAYKVCGMTPPWKYWNVRDTRTLYEQAGVKVDRERGTHHNALDDARVQAEAAVVALQRMQNARGAAAVSVPHHFACERKGFNRLCDGCQAEQAAVAPSDDRDAALERAVQVVADRAGDAETILLVSAFDAIRSLKTNRHAPPEAVAPSDAKDAARWRETLKHIGGCHHSDGIRFTLRYLRPVTGANIMKGSVAQHFADAIDAAIAASQQGRISP